MANGQDHHEPSDDAFAGSVQTVNLVGTAANVFEDLTDGDDHVLGMIADAEELEIDIEGVEGIGQKQKRLEKKSDQEKALKKLGGVSKYKLDHEGLRDTFEVVRKLLKNVVTEKKKEIEKDKKNLQIIYNIVKHFKRKMMRNRQELVLLTKSIKQGYKKEQRK